ncbi:hypothetical protein R1sor_011713 [Riccia sorocarpa]|uniref:Uncharacterized protein n=1 Tax=Riccia sorocarpa TaxID=122646 RepID=A0ABD3I1N6_9MARC
MLGFEEWPPKDESRKNGQGHRRSSSLSKLPTLRLDIDARSDYFSTSGRTILEEDPKDRENGDEEVVEVETTSNKQQSRLSRFFTKKPSRLSAVAPSPSAEDIQVKSAARHLTF